MTDPWLTVLFVSLGSNAFVIWKLWRTPLMEEIPDRYEIANLIIQAGCFFTWFVMSHGVGMRVILGFYFVLQVIHIHNWWDKRKRRKKPSRVLGRVVDLGHRLAVVNNK